MAKLNTESVLSMFGMRRKPDAVDFSALSSLSPSDLLTALDTVKAESGGHLSFFKIGQANQVSTALYNALKTQMGQPVASTTKSAPTRIDLSVPSEARTAAPKSFPDPVAGSIVALAKENDSLKKEIRELRAEVAALKPKPTEAKANESAAKPDLEAVCLAAFGEQRMEIIRANAGPSKERLESLMLRNLYMEHIDVPGVDFSETKRVCGDRPALFGLSRFRAGEYQKKVNAHLAAIPAK